MRHLLLREFERRGSHGRGRRTTAASREKVNGRDGKVRAHTLAARTTNLVIIGRSRKRVCESKLLKLRRREEDGGARRNAHSQASRCSRSGCGGNGDGDSRVDGGGRRRGGGSGRGGGRQGRDLSQRRPRLERGRIERSLQSRFQDVLGSVGSEK